MEQDLFYDYRYEFSSLLEFISQKEFLKLEAFHLTIAFFSLLFISTRIIKFQKNLILSLSTIYFGASIYNNFAYTMYGVSIAEYIGITSAVIFLVKDKFKKNPVSSYLLVFVTLSILHFCFITIMYGLIEGDDILKRFILIAKIAVLAINSSIIIKHLDSGLKIENFFYFIIILTNITLFAYIIQMLVFFSGTLPYGSFSPAGYAESIIPSFASVSIERGHYGKFLAPLFPIYLYGFIKYGYKKSFLLFLTISLLNISASAYVFMSFYIILSIAILHKKLKISHYLLILGLITLSALIFNEQITKLIEKVYILAIQQDDEGGRGFHYLWQILEKFPLGYGYAGSTLRDLHGIENLQLNNAIVAFWGQLSYLGIIIISFLFYTYYKLYHAPPSGTLEKKILLIALVVSIIIFMSDLLWFIAPLWLSIIMIYKAGTLNANSFR